MTAEIPSGHMNEYDDDGIRRRLNTFAPDLERRLHIDGLAGRYISTLSHTLRQTNASRAMLEILPLLGDPELSQYNRSKHSPGAIGGVLGLEVAKQTLGSSWDCELTETLRSLAEDLETTSENPTLIEVCEQRSKFLSICDAGWEYGGAYAPLFDQLAQPANRIFETSGHVEEAREAFGFVLYATAVTLKCLKGRIALAAHLDPEFTNDAYEFVQNPKLWDTAIERFFEGI